MFATWEWLGPWLEWLGEDARLYAVGDAAVFGFARGKLIGDGVSDECGPVCAPGFREDAARAMAACGPFVARDLGEGEWARWLGGEVVHREPCMSIAAPDFDAWLASRPAWFRRNARAAERRVAGAGGRIVASQDFELLFRLHGLRFGDRSRLFDGARGAFYRDALPRLARAGRAELKVLEVDGEPVAAMLFLRHRGAPAYYQSGWDPRAARLSPGVALLLDAVRSHGEVSLLRGAEPYKHAWATVDRPLITVRVP